MSAAEATTKPVQDRVQSDAGQAEMDERGVLDVIRAAVVSVRGVFSSFFDLLAIEARRAGLVLVWMVMWGLVAAICVVGAWIGAMAALAMWVISLGFSPIGAVLVMSVMNIAASAALIYLCVRMSRSLLFSATRRQLAGEPPAKSVLP